MVAKLLHCVMQALMYKYQARWSSSTRLSYRTKSWMPATRIRSSSDCSVYRVARNKWVHCIQLPHF